MRRDIMDKGLQSVRDLFDLAGVDLSIDAEGEAELGARVGCVLYPDALTVCFHEGLRDREAKASASVAVSPGEQPEAVS